MSQEFFTNRELTDTVNIIPTDPMVLSSMFFPEATAEQHYADIVEFDIESEFRLVAQYSAANASYKPVDRSQAVNKDFKIPYIKHSTDVNAAALVYRMAGETLYTPVDPKARAAKMIAKDMAKLKNMIARAVEVQAAQALTSGIVVANGADFSGTFDFGRAADLTVTNSGTDNWGTSTADVLGDLDAGRVLLGKKGYYGSMVIMGHNARVNFMKDAAVGSKLDNRRIDQGALSTNGIVPVGMTYYGRVDSFDIYEYSNWYLDVDGTTLIPYIGDDDILIIDPKPDHFQRHYGLIKDMTAILGGQAGQHFFAKTWLDEDPSVQWLAVQAAPLCVPRHVNCVYRLTTRS